MIAAVVALGGLVATTAVFMRGVYKAGYTSGVAQTQTEFLERDAAAQAAVTAELNRILQENEALVQQWRTEDRVLLSAFRGELGAVLDELKEIPRGTIEVFGDCDISYDAIELLSRAANAAQPPNDN